MGCFPRMQVEVTKTVFSRSQRQKELQPSFAFPPAQRRGCPVTAVRLTPPSPVRSSHLLCPAAGCPSSFSGWNSSAQVNPPSSCSGYGLQPGAACSPRPPPPLWGAAPFGSAQVALTFPTGHRGPLPGQLLLSLLLENPQVCRHRITCLNPISSPFFFQFDVNNLHS